MGYAERLNPKSVWSKKRMMNTSSNIASPISSEPRITKVSTPALKQDEPIVIQITPKSIFSLFKEFLWRMFNLSRKAQTSREQIS